MFAALGWVSLIGLLFYGAVLFLEHLIPVRRLGAMTGGISLPGEAVP